MEKVREEKKNNLPKVIGSKCQAKVWILSGSRMSICKPGISSEPRYLAEGACRRLWPVHRHPNSCPRSGGQALDGPGVLRVSARSGWDSAAQGQGRTEEIIKQASRQEAVGKSGARFSQRIN